MKKIIILIIICLVFCSCGNIYKQDLEVAEYGCKDHGGVFFIDPILIVTVNCNDGFSFNVNDVIRKSYIDSINSIK